MDTKWRLIDSLAYRPGVTMRRRGQACAVAIALLATFLIAEPSLGGALRAHGGMVPSPSSGGLTDELAAAMPRAVLVSDEPKQDQPDTIVFALMSGKCPTLKIASRDFRCRAVAFYQTELGRANFTIALDDPADNSHIITFSGDNGQRKQDDLYELPIDRMLLNSKNRPKADGLPVPFVESSTGMCTQLGNFAERQVSSISCSATDKDGKKYELKYESDGSPITLRRLKRTRAGRPQISPFD
jgi:hypothetical protein